MDGQTELLEKILELLTLIAEPQIAIRDAAGRAALAAIVGKGKLKAKAITLMDGTRPQAVIRKEVPMDQGGLSRLTSALRQAGLIGDDDNPRLSIPLPPGFMADLEK